MELRYLRSVERSPVRTLVILRHAEALPTPLGGRDFDRRLSPRGVDQARSVGQKLGTWEPKLVLVSPARRTVETCREVLEGRTLPTDPEIQTLPFLYDTCGEGIVDHLRGLDQSTRDVLVVGHNPSIAELVSLLDSDQARAARRNFSPSSFARFEFSSEWVDLDASTAVLIEEGTG